MSIITTRRNARRVAESLALVHQYGQAARRPRGPWATHNPRCQCNVCK